VPLSSVDVTVFEPNGTPPDLHRFSAAPNMTAGRAALVALMHRYLGGLLDPFVTLLEVHKLMYFMQEIGQDLKLGYTKGHYGPYAEKLRHVLRTVEGHLVSGYADGGDAPGKQLYLVPGAVDDAADYLSSDNDTRARLDRVNDLVAGFETPIGLELLSTVHWVASREGASTAQAAVKKVYEWSDHKKKFTPRQISLAFETLARKGWL